MKQIVIVFFVYLAIVATVRAENVVAVELRTEQMKNPFGLNTAEPRLSWRIESSENNLIQKAYRILVASSAELLDKGVGDLWDSGTVKSDESLFILYNGKKLASNQRCYWKVKVYTNKGNSHWSKPAYWSIGLLHEYNWSGHWIGFDDCFPGDSKSYNSRMSARYLRKEFLIEKKIKQATVHISGLGLYELFINGSRIGDQVLAPIATDYRKSVMYDSFDVTKQLDKENAIGVVLGNGRYFTMRQNAKPYSIINFGYPKLRLNLLVEYTDGSKDTIATDATWKLTADGPIRSNNEYDGEEYDAQKELGAWTIPGYSDSKWINARRVSIPTGTLRGRMTPAIKVLKSIKPCAIYKSKGKWILDMGQNIVGRLRMKMRRHQAGDTIRLRFAELLKGDKELYTDNLRSAHNTDLYICNGKENDTTWAPAFVYHGFRYVEITGYGEASCDDFVGEVISDEMERTGTFSCSDSTLNRIFENATWGIWGNYKGFPVDCPQRDERQPWLGDRVMGALGESYLFENGMLYAKWMMDIREGQREDGCLPNIAPGYWRNYADNVSWPSALPFICEMLYTQFGNNTPIAESYDAIRKWMEHFREGYKSENGIITIDRYGDWCVPPESPLLIHSKDPNRQTAGELIATAYYIKNTQLLQRFASLLKLDSERSFWAKEERITTEAFNRHFLTRSSQDAYYGNNTVTANLLPLAFDIVPTQHVDKVVERLIRTIAENGNHIRCGVIGVQWLLRELSRRGHAGLACKLACNTDYPSWGYMVKKGATTIWELWNGDTASPKMNSGNHVMLLGDLLSWCFECLGGISSDKERVGYKRIILAPNFTIEGINQVSAAHRCPYGTVKSTWERTGNRVAWEIEIPANTTAVIHLPSGKRKTIGSGKHTFNISLNK